MSVYMILDAEVHDPVEYEKYKAAAPQYVARHGGEYCCRGGAVNKSGNGANRLSKGSLCRNFNTFAILCYTVSIIKDL